MLGRHRYLGRVIPLVLVGSPLVGLIALGLTGLVEVTALPGAESQGAGDSSKMLQAELQGMCAQCHKPFVDEWSTSRHAKAFSGANYQKMAEANPERMAQCDSCHAPGLVQFSGPGRSPSFRGKANVPDRGIMCICCHMDANGAMHGPFGGQTDFHKTVKDPNYQRSNAVCISCHGQTGGAADDFNQAVGFAVYSRQSQGAACGDCHMPAVERPASSEAGAPKRQCGEHSWKASYDKGMLSSAAILDLKVSGTTATSSVSNITGHLMPGGALRQAVLEIVANNQVAKREVFTRQVGGATDTRLKPLEKRVITATVPAGANVEARLWWKSMPDTPDNQRVLMSQATAGHNEGGVTTVLRTRLQPRQRQE